MNTIIKKVDYLDSELASAIASENVNRPMKSVDRTYLREIKGMNYVKVVLKTKNARVIVTGKQIGRAHV